MMNLLEITLKLNFICENASLLTILLTQLFINKIIDEFVLTLLTFSPSV